MYKNKMNKDVFFYYYCMDICLLYRMIYIISGKWLCNR